MVTILAKVLQKVASVLALGQLRHALAHAAMIIIICKWGTFVVGVALWWGAGQGSLTEILAWESREGALPEGVS